MKWTIAGAIVVALVIWVVSRAQRGRRRPTVGALWSRLRKLTHDPLVADRLVMAELKRHPEMDEATALRHVIQRLERDRR